MSNTKKTSQGNRVGIGIVGAGARGIGNLGKWICSEYRKHRLRIAAICDNHDLRLKDAEKFLKSQFKYNGISDKFKTYNQMEDLITDSDVELVMITTPQSVHEKPFKIAAEAGKMIYCEKPLAHSQKACDNMLKIFRKNKPRCFIGFTRRYEPLWVRAHKMVSEGAVGQPHMVLLRSIIPYSFYFAGWWRQTTWSGGLLNEKCAHHFDTLNWFTGSYPVRVQAIGGRRVFVPREGYPSRCSECDDLSCPYRIGKEFLEYRVADNVPPLRLSYDYDVDLPMSHELCVYSPQADVIDHAIVNLNFANGMVGCLFFSVFGQHSDDQETLEIIGEEGKLVLSRHALTIEVIGKFGKEKALHKYEGQAVSLGHFGADPVMINLLSKFSLTGQEPPVGFKDAYIASKTAFMAEQSLVDGTTKNLDYSLLRASNKKKNLSNDSGTF